MIETDATDAHLGGGVDRPAAAPASPPLAPPPPPTTTSASNTNQQHSASTAIRTTTGWHRSSAWGRGGKGPEDVARVATLLGVLSRLSGRKTCQVRGGYRVTCLGTASFLAASGAGNSSRTTPPTLQRERKAAGHKRSAEPSQRAPHPLSTRRRSRPTVCRHPPGRSVPSRPVVDFFFYRLDPSRPNSRCAVPSRHEIPYVPSYPAVKKLCVALYRPALPRGKHIYRPISSDKLVHLLLPSRPVPSLKTTRCTEPSRPVVKICPVEFYRPVPPRKCSPTVPSRPAAPTFYVLIFPSLNAFIFFPPNRLKLPRPVPSRFSVTVILCLVTDVSGGRIFPQQLQKPLRNNFKD